MSDARPRSRRLILLSLGGNRALMPYGFIVLVAGIALVAYFDFATEASWITKAVVSGLYIEMLFGVGTEQANI